MDKKSVEQVKDENLEILLSELVQEQKQQSKTMVDVVKAMNTLTGKLDQLPEKLEAQKEVQPNIDISPLVDVLKISLTDIKLMISAYPKSTTKKVQILLFPEQGARLFYKIVFGRWFIWLAIMLFLSLTYKWIIHREDNNKQMIMEAWKNDNIIKAWNYLYQLNNKSLHRLMDSAFRKSDVPSR